MRKVFVLLLVVFVASPCLALPKIKIVDGSLVVYKILSKGMLSKSYKCNIKIRNIETNEEYQTSEIQRFKGFAFIANLPIGRYKIIKMSVPFSTGYFAVDADKITNLIEINEAMVLNLGSYQINVTPGTGKLEVIRDNNEKDTEDLIKFLNKDNKGWEKLKINSDNKMFIDDIFVI